MKRVFTFFLELIMHSQSHTQISKHHDYPNLSLQDVQINESLVYWLQSQSFVFTSRSTANVILAWSAALLLVGLKPTEVTACD